MYKEERGMLKEMGQTDECELQKAVLLYYIVARKRSLSWEIDGHKKRNRKGIR